MLALLLTQSTQVKRSFTGQHGEEYQIPGGFKPLPGGLHLRSRLLVPGLKDNARRDVRRGRYRLTGSDVMTVFDPVVKEVVSLVLGQIDATQQAVKAVLLVGGFGQNTFLRDSIRQAIAPQGIEVMQSPNG